MNQRIQIMIAIQKYEAMGCWYMVKCLKRILNECV